tara:strand:+ start:3279 stop:4277 length:999 start_codon:yes stop_codon:yes gene_type:complete
MTQVLIVRGEDRHTYRLEQGMRMCDINYRTVEKYEDIPGDKCDVIFVDPSLSFDPTPKLNSDHVLFYDCEDSPKDFNPGSAYEAMKDKVQFYAKMNWLEDDRGDGIRNIGFPLGVCLPLSQCAEIEAPPFSHHNAIPFFLGTGTFLGRHEPVKGGNYICDTDLNVSSLGKYEDHYMYNQRIDWLLSLRKNNIPHVGGIVFTESNLSKEWQSQYFGAGVELLEIGMIPHDKYLETLFNCRVGLCPTGHDRNSWRVFDIMATGAILIWTDSENQKSMYMPKEYVTVEDGEDLGKKLLSIQPDYDELWKACQENRKVFQGLTPEKIWEDFMEQMS